MALRFIEASCLGPLLFLCFLEYLDTTFPTRLSTGSLSLLSTFGSDCWSFGCIRLSSEFGVGGRARRTRGLGGFQTRRGTQNRVCFQPSLEGTSKTSLKNKRISFLVILPLLRVLAKMAQQCLTLGNPMDCSLPGSSIHGILHTKTLERVTSLFSGESSSPRD